MTKHFKHITHSTCSDDGLWMAWDADTQTMSVVELAYWADMDSSFTDGKYNVQCGMVVLSLPDTSDWRRDTLAHDQAGALRSCGYEFSTEADVATFGCPAGSIVARFSGDVVCRCDNKHFKYVLATCMWEYGAKEVWSDTSGFNRAKLLRDARHEVG